METPSSTQTLDTASDSGTGSHSGDFDNRGFTLVVRTKKTNLSGFGRKMEGKEVEKALYREVPVKGGGEMRLQLERHVASMGFLF